MSDSSKIIGRIKRQYGAELFDELSQKITLPDLQSLLLEVFRIRVSKLSTQYLAKQFRENRFVQPSSIDPRLFLKMDELAFSLDENYEPIELSPVSPLGSNAIIAPVDQNNAISTIRNSEVCSDSSNILALIAANRRAVLLKDNPKSNDSVKLCASFRVVRGQLFQGAGSVPHFRLYTRVTAGRDVGSFLFELEVLFEHIDFYLRYLKALGKINIQLNDISVSIRDFTMKREAQLKKELLLPLKKKHRFIQFQLQAARQPGSGYYESVGFQISARENQGSNMLLVDGGFTDWTQQLLNNKKERLLTSGLGTERLCLCFKKDIDSYLSS